MDFDIALFGLCHTRTGVLLEHKWENALTLDRHSWGYRREAVVEDYLSIEELLQQLAVTIRCVVAFCLISWLSIDN